MNSFVIDLLSNTALIISLAFILDIIIGDPAYAFHPVRLIGSLIFVLESPFRNISKNQYINGLIFALTILVLICLGLSGIFYVCFLVDRKLGYTVVTVLVSIYFIYSSLCLKDLKDKSVEIYRLLMDNDLEGARRKVSLIVGRDTENLDRKEIIRACIETISENIVDGMFSPLFYSLGGPVPALVYKGINTLDSMVGYKNEKYMLFGRASARIDDAANYIPARLSLFFISLAAFLCGKNGFHVFAIGLRDGKKNPSPNSGIPEAAFAGALGIQLGGTNYYQGVKSEKVLIGDKTQVLDEKHISSAITLAYLSVFLFTLFITMLHYMIFHRMFFS